jgi:hypothetical protein
MVGAEGRWREKGNDQRRGRKKRGGVEESGHRAAFLETAGTLKPNHRAGGASGHCPPSGGHFGNAAAPTARARPSGSAGHHRLAKGIVGISAAGRQFGDPGAGLQVSSSSKRGTTCTAQDSGHRTPLGFGAGTRSGFMWYRSPIHWCLILLHTDLSTLPFCFCPPCYLFVNRPKSL